MPVLLAAALAAAALTTAPGAAAATPIPAVHTSGTGTASASASPFLSAQQAGARARATGKPVVASALTSETSLTTANPNGTLTLTQSAVPTRVLQHGVWANLDATLRANADGTLSPTATTSAVVLSGGGRGALASLYTGGQGFTLTLPVALPHPTLSGPSAVYHDVIPNVDLTVTVQTSGAVSDVFTVRTAAAAHDPRLAGLLNATASTTSGLHIAADTSGNLAVADTHGHPLYTAPAPRAWDSATTTVPAALARSAAAPQLASTPGAPAHGAHTAKLTVTTRPGTITLTAPTSLLNATSTIYPIYLDPTYSPNYPNAGWSSPGSGVPDTPYWNGTVDAGPNDGDAEVGNSGDVQGEAMSLFNFPIYLATLRGAKIYGAYFGITENSSWACLTSGHDQAVDLYAPSPTTTLSNTNATWNSWVGNLGNSIASQSFALGYTTCPGGGIPAYNVTSTVTNDIANGKGEQTLVMRADDHSDNYAFKEFDPNSAQLTVTYDQYPNTPSALKTSPATNCAGSTLGDTGVTLYATASTPTRSSLTTTIHLYKTADSTKTNLLTSDTWTGGSGQAAVLTVAETFFKAQAGGVATSFTFIAQTTDGTLPSGWSSGCTFNWDPTRPGAPVVAPNPSPGNDKTCATHDSTIGTVQPIGSTCSFHLTPPTKNGTTTTISGYSYQVNQSPSVQVLINGSTDISVPLTRLVNTLTVSALSAGGNLGDPVPVWFDGSRLSPPANDGDLTLDGIPDLILPGGTGTAFPPGLWLAPGKTDGTVATKAVNIGSSGLGYNFNDATPGDWNGAQAVTGNFCGNGAQDVLAYFHGGSNPGGGGVVCNDGSSDRLHVGGLGGDNAPYKIDAGSLKDSSGNNATQVAAAGNTSGQNQVYPDLFATINSHLVLFFATVPAGYNDSFNCITGGCYTLANLNSPDGNQDWNTWTITTAQLSSGTAMYMWQPSTGKLALWTGLHLDTTTKSTLTIANQYTFDDGSQGHQWNLGKNLILRAADFSGAGIPDLWSTDPAGTVTTASVASNLASNPTLTTASTSTTSTASHAWYFQDISTNATPLTSTADSIGSLGLTGTPGAVWNTGDIYSPDALLNTLPDGSTPSGGTGSLATTGNVLDLTNSFTVSLWAFPSAYGGAVLSQDGANNSANSGITLAPTANGWQFNLNTGSGTAWAFDTISGGTAQLGTWAHLTATYDKTAGVMNLYVDDIFVASGTHSAAGAGVGGNFQLGDDQHSTPPTTHTDYFTGRIANVQTWSGSVVPPTQPASPAGYHQALTPTRILDTRTGGTLTNYKGNTYANVTAGNSTVEGGSTTMLQIANDNITSATGAPGTIPNTVTAVAVDVTVTNETGGSFVTAYADHTQQPLTSSTNFNANQTVTGYQIVPVGNDGRIDLHLAGGAYTAALIVDITGYFTSDSTLTGDQTYTPLNTATRALDTRSSTTNTNLTSGQVSSNGAVASDTPFTLQITGSPYGVPAAATAVAVNLTAANETGTGYFMAYATGGTPPTADTSLSFDTASPYASMAADVPIGNDGKITIDVHTSAAVIVDISGYYTTTTTTGQKYHPVNPTRIVDTRSGIGGTKGAVGSLGTYILSQADTQQITTAATPTLAAMTTVTDTAGGGGSSTVYPTQGGKPATTNLNWPAGATLANLTLTPTDTNGSISIYNNSYSPVDFIVDCSGYFN
ncbi:LamG-like jellyroll fold domain-containing protein [Streptacidiphilus sp. MAP12-16]|uniref:LamG-like jellyroll fold domain-containing protein n=1 Tax=Streptacidiphilus sp. MAP12-16 TaxID=3156300 RepID=UPI003516EBEE